MPYSPQINSSVSKGTIRKLGASFSTPDKRPYRKASVEDEPPQAMLDILMSMQADLKKSVDEQQKFRQSIEQRLSNLEANINSKIAGECKAIREDMTMELVKVSDKIKSVEAKVHELRNEVSEDIGQLRNRVSCLESGEKEAYNPARTIVATGVQYSRGEDIQKKAKELVDKVLKVKGQIVNVERTPIRDGNRPGIVKIEFKTKEEKIEALRAKGRLSSSQTHKSVYIRSAQSHEERLLHQNTRVLLKEMGAEQRFRITGSGRLVPKNPDERLQPRQNDMDASQTQE